MKKLLFRLACTLPPLATFTLATPLLLHELKNPVEFNQFLLQDLATRSEGVRSTEALERAKSAFRSGLGILRANPGIEPPPLGDTWGMFDHVFSWVPDYAVVYPTERFYYFALTNGERKVMGNIRLAELDQGRVSFAYFTVPDKETWITSVSAEDGLQVDVLSSADYLVSWKGKTVHFHIERTEAIGPANLATLPEEEVLGQLYDESGIRLFVMYNNETNSFYNVLNEEAPAGDVLVPLEDPRFLVGERTGFVFYSDEPFKRKLLVGVALENVKANNYLDGPGDQVPIALDLRDKLHIAYPNTLRGDGIDEHGVYLRTEEWSRIAVSPYIRYVSFDEFPKRLASCEGEQDRSILWTCLTKEWWNTENWRESVFEELESEGKTVDRSHFVWTSN